MSLYRKKLTVQYIFLFIIFSLSKYGLKITYNETSIVLSVSVYLNIIKQTETRIQMIKW